MVGPGVAEEIVVRFEEEGMLMTPESWCARREEGWRAGWGMVLEINLRVLLRLDHIKSASHRR